MKNKKIKRRKIKYKNVTVLLVIVTILLGICYYITTARVENIYIEGNSILTDQQIIDEVGLRKYPKIININRKKMKENLINNPYIDEVDIEYGNLMREVKIKIKENKPLLYYQYEDAYLLSNGKRIKDKYSLPSLINQTPEGILEKLLKRLYKLDDNVLGRISEIKYSPSKVNDNLFYLTMNDGNLVYIDFNTFNKLENYPDFIKGLDGKKGILHLDSGDYLEIFK